MATWSWNKIQAGHQSEPVKSINISFLSVFACAKALARSVPQFKSAACDCNQTQLMRRHKEKFFHESVC